MLRGWSRRSSCSTRSQLPRHWYNVRADMPNPPPPVLHPGTGQPVGPDDLAPLFPMELILQEVSEEPEIAIPEEVLDIYRLWRPTPLYRAHRLEQAIGTRSRIFYKYEGVSPAGSHKPNTAVAQAFYNKQEGRTRLATETGAGQWGSALAFACKLFGLECKVYMVRVSYDQKPFRRSLIQTWGAEIVASPSEDTQSGRAILAEHPGLARQPRHRDLRGGRGRGAPRRHRVLARQRAQPRAAAPDGDRPGGDRADGARRRVPGRRGRLRRRRLELRRARLPVHPREDRRPRDRRPRLRAGRLPDADARPLRLRLRRHGQADAARPDAHARPRLRPRADPRRRPALPRRGAAGLAARARRADPRRGLPPERRLRRGRPLRAHRGHHPGARVGARDPGAIEAARQADEAGEERTILFNLSGHGHFDMAAYDNYFAGKLVDFALDDDEEIERALRAIEGLPTPA